MRVSSNTSRNGRLDEMTANGKLTHAQSSGPDALIFDDVRLSVNARVLLAVSFAVRPGEIVTVMGPSGVGKSSLLAFAAGFLPAEFVASGDIRLGVRSLLPLPAHRRRLGLLFQDALLFPHLSVLENLLFALPRGSPGRRETALAALTRVGLAKHATADPATLSGGEAARIALMRVLLAAPRALLLDEPFSKLDRRQRVEIRDFVFSTAHAQRLPTVLVTHDETDAAAAGGPVIFV